MFIDGYLAPVKSASRADYAKMCEAMSALFRDHGALEVIDAWGVDVPEGKLTSFPLALKLEADETVAFGWITWPDKATRDAGFAAAMKDERMAQMNMEYVDGKRMVFGGFEALNRG